MWKVTVRFDFTCNRIFFSFNFGFCPNSNMARITLFYFLLEHTQHMAKLILSLSEIEMFLASVWLLFLNLNGIICSNYSNRWSTLNNIRKIIGYIISTIQSQRENQIYWIVTDRAEWKLSIPKIIWTYLQISTCAFNTSSIIMHRHDHAQFCGITE